MTLIERPVRSIIRAVAAAAAAWTDARFPPRVRALRDVCERTGYSVPVVEYAFDRLFAPLSTAAIEATIAGELGSLDVLDGFVGAAGAPRVRALPVGRVCVVSSRTTIGVAIVPAIFALCAKCSTVVKDREDALAAAFFSTLACELPEFEAAAVARSWDGAAGARALEGFSAVVAFGDDATLEEIRAHLPAAVGLRGFGSKASCGYVARESLAAAAAARAVASGAARDLLLYDGEGCLSLHVLFVERGGALSPPDFAEILAREIARGAAAFPIGTRDPREAARVAAARDLALFRSGAASVRSDRPATYLTVLDPPRDEPPPFLARTLPIHAVDDPAEAAAYLERHRVPVEAIAVSDGRDDVVAAAVRLGAARITSFGRLQAPPVATRHGGGWRIAGFVRWIADET